MKCDQLSKKSGSKVLIIGGGYVGGYLKDHLGDHYNIMVVESKDVDYHNSNIFWKLLLGEDPPFVINCSGFTGRPNIDEAETNKELCWKLNVETPLMMATLCYKFGARFIHIGSGCIYDGYDKEYTEEDTPNFGLWNEYSSFYSKSKHAFETLTKHLAVKHVRIRMPLSSLSDSRSFLTKIRNYDNLINYQNSKTDMEDLVMFVDKLMEQTYWQTTEFFNVVNPEPLTTLEICEEMIKHGVGNDNWEYVSIDEIPIKAGRSNCVLDGSKVSKIHQMKTEKEALLEILKNDKINN